VAFSPEIKGPILLWQAGEGWVGNGKRKNRKDIPDAIRRQPFPGAQGWQ